MPKTSVHNARELQLVDKWYALCNELWPLLLATPARNGERAVRTQSLARVGAVQSRLRAVTERLAIEAERAGLSPETYIDLSSRLTPLRAPTGLQWDDAWRLTKRLESRIRAALSARNGQGGRLRSRRPARSPKQLTAKQTEAVHLVGEHKGNVSAAARAMGRDPKTVRQHYEAGMKKLGKAGVPLGKTKRLTHDRRGQPDVTTDRRRA